VNIQEIRLKGLPICRGIAIGKPFFFHVVEEVVPNVLIDPQDIDKEIERYRQALVKTRDDLKRLQKQLEKENVVEGAEILEAQAEILQDPLLTEAVEYKIEQQCRNAEIVFHEHITYIQEKFSLLPDPIFRERFKDIQDISRRVMSYLLKIVRASSSEIPDGSILFARELTTTDIVEANKSVIAFVSHFGGITSHAAIVAKAKGIPYITSVEYEFIESFQNCELILDARTGDIIVNPDEKTLIVYQDLKARLNLHHTKLDFIQHLPPETYDGYSVRLSANIETSTEVEMLHQFGGMGVGLFRSESAFISEKGFPNEEDQFELYRNIFVKMQGLPIVIRTFDVGGDKFLGNQLMVKESNPYLGCRAIRFLLKEAEVFKSHLRAIIRAASYGDVSIMFPMVSSLQELLEAKNIVREVTEELLRQDVVIPSKIRMGCMIEVPSAAIISDLLAKECDFLSIGTNDLIQYALAVDRGNHSMSSHYTPTHPSVIRLIKFIVNEANIQDIPVTVCGEIASDPRFTPLLLGLGVHELSVAARYLPIIKNAIRSTSIIDAYKLAENALALSTAHEIQQLITQEYKKNVPEDVYYNI
jgi:phosphotransferase system enzyme I (PtsI)